MDYGAEWMRSTADDRRRLQRARHALCDAMNGESMPLEAVFSLHQAYWMLLQRFVGRLDESQALSLLYDFRWQRLDGSGVHSVRDIRMELMLLTYNSAALHTQLACKAIRDAVNGGCTELSPPQLQQIAAHYSRAQQLLSTQVSAPWSALLAQSGSDFQGAVACVGDLQLRQIGAQAKLCHALAALWWCSAQDASAHQRCACSFLSASHQLAALVDNEDTSGQRAVIQALAAYAQLRSDLHACEYLLIYVPEDQSLRAAYEARVRRMHRSMQAGSPPLALHVPFFLSAGFVMEKLQGRSKLCDGEAEKTGQGPAPSHPSLTAQAIQPGDCSLPQTQELARLSEESKAFLWMRQAEGRQAQMDIYSNWYTYKLQGADLLVEEAACQTRAALNQALYPWLLLELDPERFSGLAPKESQTVEKLVKSCIPGLLEDTQSCIGSDLPQLTAFKQALEELSPESPDIGRIYERLKDAVREAQDLVLSCQRRLESLQAAVEGLPGAESKPESNPNKPEEPLHSYLESLLFLQRSLSSLRCVAEGMMLSDTQTPASSAWLLSQYTTCKRHRKDVARACGSLKKAFRKLTADETALYVRRSQLKWNAMSVERDATDVYHYYSVWSSFVRSLSIHNPHYRGGENIKLS